VWVVCGCEREIAGNCQQPAAVSLMMPHRHLRHCAAALLLLAIACQGLPSTHTHTHDLSLTLSLTRLCSCLGVDAGSLPPLTGNPVADPRAVVVRAIAIAIALLLSLTSRASCHSTRLDPGTAPSHGPDGPPAPPQLRAACRV
jgi:hypothetical protein